MKFFKSFSLIVILAFAVAAVCGMVKGLAALCVFLGIGKLVEGKERKGERYRYNHFRHDGAWQHPA